jgi:hypothetical protein
VQRSTTCSNCLSIKAEYICDKCQSDYCLECYQTIHAARALQHHRRTPINNKLSEILLCQIHQDEKLKYWRHICKKPVCNDCLLHEHKNHTYILVNKAAQQLETKVSIRIFSS